MRSQLLMLLAGMHTHIHGLVIPPKNYACEDKRCVITTNSTAPKLSFYPCKIMCETNIFPIPTAVSVGTDVVEVAADVVWNTTKTPPASKALVDEMLATFKNTKSAAASSAPALTVNVVFSDDSSTLSMSTDESYTIQTVHSSADSVVVSVTSVTCFGMRHGLETLFQTINFDKFSQTYKMPASLAVTDAPAFPYRGIMVDTARNFITLEKLQTIIKGMSMSKLNRLHLHLSDTASFPVEVEARPNVTLEGAYSNAEFYSIADLQVLFHFGIVHGVDVIPEIDQPAHARQGFRWGEEAGLGRLVMCAPNPDPGAWKANAPEPPSGQFNPVNENVYTVLGEVYASLVKGLGGGLYHMGGDEVQVGSDTKGPACWNSSVEAPEIMAHLEKIGADRSDINTFLELWANFTIASTAEVKKAYAAQGKKLDKLIQWGGGGGANLVNSRYLAAAFPQDTFMFQVWDGYSGSLLKKLAGDGYDVIMSNADLFYLDCGREKWDARGHSWCAYNSWRNVYDSLPTAQAKWNLTSEEMSRLKGAEAPMWSEMADSTTIVSAMFPRASALGERFWSNPKGNWYDADPRIELHRYRLVDNGVPSHAIQAQWCLQNGPYACTV